MRRLNQICQELIKQDSIWIKQNKGKPIPFYFVPELIDFICLPIENRRRR